MKKSLFLLPLLACAVLSGCEKSEKKGSKEPFVIDFSAGDVEVEDYIDINTPCSFEFEDIEFAGVGCYDEQNLGCLFMRNKKNGDGDTVEYAEDFAWFGNVTPFDNPISSVEVTLNSGDGVSSNTTYRVTISDEAAEEAQKTGGKTGKASKTAEKVIKATAKTEDCHYFAVSTGGKYNGQVLKVVVNF